MARETNKKIKDKEEKETVKEKISKKVANTSKKVLEKEKKEVAKKAKTTAKKKTASNVAKSEKKTSTTRKTSAKSSDKKTDVKKNVSLKSNKASTKKKTSSSTKIKPTAKPMLAEYYDLPYRYNETTVKILAQTPTTLFVYWDLSDADRDTLTAKYGDNLFYETIPILIVHNITKNYSFEIEINDFANSWYIRTQEPNCDYIIELGRKMIHNNNEYIHIYSSNDIVSPNDHILFEKTDLGNVVFRNVKTGVLSSKDFGSLRFINDMDKIYGNVYDVYSKLYKEEILNDFTNPSSGEFILKK